MAASHKEEPPFMGGVHPSRHHVLKKNSRLRQIECILYLNLPFPVLQLPFHFALLRVIQGIKLK